MINRRDFLKTAGVGAAAFALDGMDPLSAAPKKKKKENAAAPSDKVKVALIGIGFRGNENAKKVHETGMCDVIALCDVNMGAAHTQEIIGLYPKARRYQDFRKLFDELAGQLDAVFVSVPDFAHFAIAMHAIKCGVSVYSEKPLGLTFYQNELLAEAARRNPKVVTQMGNQGHSGPGYFQFKEWVDAGIIKNVTRINTHFNNTRRWYGYDTSISKYPEAEPVPQTMDWDTWLMQTKWHDYSSKYDPGNWRGWYDFGNGALGDWGAHIFDNAHEFLQLGLPTEVSILNEEGHNDYFFPMSSTIKFHFPRRGDKPACDMYWYEGLNNMPELPAGYGVSEASDVPLVGGKAYVPTKLNPGKEIYSDEYIFKGGSHSSKLEIIPKELNDELDKAGKLPHEPEGYHFNHYINFLNAIRGTEKAHSPFEIAGELCQVINLGVIAQRLNTSFRFDRGSKEIMDNPFANALLTGEPPRKGWEEYFKL